VAVVPLIVFLCAVPLDDGVAQYWSGAKTDYDFFSYYKAMAVVFMTAAGCVALIVLRRRIEDSFPPVVPAALLALYATLVLASALASPYPSIVWKGFVGRYEGFWVLVSYVALVVCSYALFDRPVWLRRQAWCLVCCSIVVSAIGLLQRVGYDPFRTRIGKAAILPATFANRIDAVSFRLPDGQIYSTLGHYNYVGSYAALVLPLLLSLAVGSEHRALRGVSRAAAVTLAFVWIACGSRAGLIGGVFGLGVLLLGLRQLWLQYAWRITGLVLVAIAAVLIIRPQPVRRALQGAHAGIANLLAPVGEAERTRFESLPVRAVSTAGNQLRLETRRGELVIVDQNGTMSVSDATGRPLEVFVETGSNRVTITDERFSGFELLNGTLNGHSALVVRQGPFVMRFLLTANGFAYVSQAGQPLPLSPVAVWGGKGHEDMASARVYIWSRSIPLLRGTFFVGYGPDTFAAVFPQQDFAGKYLAYGTSEMLVDKPHNFYLQAALSTGVLSVIALILLFLSFVRSASQVYWSQFRREEGWFIGLGCFAGVVGFLCAGTFNDSVVSVAPVFWIMLGTGMRANARVLGKAVD